MTVHVDKSLRLPPSEYFPEVQRKTGIAIHHTVCVSAHATVELWRNDKTGDGAPRPVATAFVIDRDGIIYEVFDPAAWGWQFGLSWRDEDRIAFEKRFIGIEIASEGGLVEQHGELYAFDRVSPVTIKARSEAFDGGTFYRGYRWFDRYEPEQLESLGRLVDDLCTRFSIPRRYPEKPFLYYGDGLRQFEGVIGHAMVRSDKSDPMPDPQLWTMLEERAALKPMRVTPSARASGAATPLTLFEIQALADRNARRLNQMDVAAGSIVKALVMELERRRVYLKLDEPAVGGAHAIGYDVVQGDRGQVARVANALGFKAVTDRLLEVSDA